MVLMKFVAFTFSLWALTLNTVSRIPIGKQCANYSTANVVTIRHPIHERKVDIRFCLHIRNNCSNVLFLVPNYYVNNKC